MQNKRIIVLNIGSTSFKFKYYHNGIKDGVKAYGNLENIGFDTGKYKIILGEKCVEGQCEISNHQQAFELCVKMLCKEKVLLSMDDLDAVGYKAVHAGALSGARIVDDKLLQQMAKYLSFAPVHNKSYMTMMEQILKEYPNLLQIAYFETSFHSSIPEKRALYGVPYEWNEKYGIRRYGFHGSSHSYIAKKTKELEPKANRIISIHLGGSSSICAIKNGVSIANSMGATPQSGLFQNNRVGDFDVFCIPVLYEQMNGDLDKVMDMLSTQSGFLGLTGCSNDFREVLEMVENNNQRAQLALAAFIDNIVGYIGMYIAYLKGVDAIVFTGGIGQNSNKLRNLVCGELGYMGILLDQDKNSLNDGGKISSIDSSISIYALETNEELMVAMQCEKFINSQESE